MKRVTASSMIGRGTTYHSFGVAFPAVSFNCTLSDNWCNTVSNVTALILYTKTEGGNPSSVNLCGRRESNPYASRHQILSLACLPISTRPHYFKLPFLTERTANIQYFFNNPENILCKSGSYHHLRASGRKHFQKAPKPSYRRRPGISANEATRKRRS